MAKEKKQEASIRMLPLWNREGLRLVECRVSPPLRRCWMPPLKPQRAQARQLGVAEGCNALFLLSSPSRGEEYR
jgi:hypothetical protein